jgi:tetrahydromethanopterin S-methyltransferase subunit D
MPAPTLARPAVAAPSLFGTALWRFAATLLYACSLMLIPHDLPAAVFALLAALVCLPGARAALRERTGLRVGAALTAAGATGLLLCAVAMTGHPAQAAISSASDGAVPDASQAGKP